MLIPISVLVGSKLDRRSKISVSLVMALGAVGSVSSVMRTIHLHGLALTGNGLTRKLHCPPSSNTLSKKGDSKLDESNHLGDR